MPASDRGRSGAGSVALLDDPALRLFGPPTPASRLDHLEPVAQVPMSIDIHTHSVLAARRNAQDGPGRRDTPIWMLLSAIGQARRVVARHSIPS